MWLGEVEARERARKRPAGGRSPPQAQAELEQIGGAALTEGSFTNPLSEPWTISESCFRFREPDKLLFDERLDHGESFSVEGMFAAAAKFDEKNVGGSAFSGRN